MLLDQKSPVVAAASSADVTPRSSRSCPVCCYPESEAVWHLELVVPEAFSLQSRFSVNTCTRCGAAFHDVDPQADRNGYYESYTGSDRIHYQITAEQARLNDLTVGFLERQGLASKGLAIADVGCSFGITLMSLRQRGFNNLYAIDPDRAAIRYLMQQGIAGRTGLATDPFPELENKFDLILLRHVLEHLYSPLEAVNNVAKWLKPKGKIYIELPDLALFFESGPFPGFFFEYEHINHFSLCSLLNLMRGFSLTHYESTSEIYPCLRTLFEKSDVMQPLSFNAKDAQCVRESLSLPSKKGKVVLENIARLGTREIALWGVSKFVYRLLTHTQLRNCNIRHMVDRNLQRQGERLLGVTIESPETLRSFKGDIVICGE
ncbi:MAG: class I SAM-dependent methyltransferase, partial [Sulfurimicrobium sp.]|nr:class I SAM-dependent methyltransferase [Sulfurimicrobium sp.]